MNKLALESAKGLELYNDMLDLIKERKGLRSEMKDVNTQIKSLKENIIEEIRKKNVSCFNTDEEILKQYYEYYEKRTN